MSFERGDGQEVCESRSQLLSTLHKLKKEKQGLTREAMAEVAQALGLTLSDVYGTATFYSFLSPKERGRHVIRVCKCYPCEIKGAQKILECIAEAIGIVPGETTSDGRFSFELVNCVGACDKAPALLINDDLHVELTPQRITDILKTYS